MAEESGLRPGDKVLCVDGVPLRGMLKDALAGKESTELLAAVDTEGGQGGGDADGDGELDEGEDGLGWEVTQVIAPCTVTARYTALPSDEGEDGLGSHTGGLNRPPLPTPLLPPPPSRVAFRLRRSPNAHPLSPCPLSPCSSPPQSRLVATLLSKRAPPDDGLHVGDDVFAMTGDWREAVVEQQVGDQYLLHLGHGERRWASGGEIAWHDLGPKPYDVEMGKPMLGCAALALVTDVSVVIRTTRRWGSRCRDDHITPRIVVIPLHDRYVSVSRILIRWDDNARAFQNVDLLKPAGKSWIVRFDCGHERKLSVSQLRERWALPLRVLGYWGDYHNAKVCNAM